MVTRRREDVGGYAFTSERDEAHRKPWQAMISGLIPYAGAASGGDQARTEKLTLAPPSVGWAIY